MPFVFSILFNVESHIAKVRMHLYYKSAHFTRGMSKPMKNNNWVYIYIKLLFPYALKAHFALPKLAKIPSPAK